MEQSVKDRVSGIVLPVAFAAVLLVLWQTQALHAILGTDTFTFPLPGHIARILAGNVPKILENLSATCTVVFGGLAIGCVAGYGISVAAAMSPRWGVGGLRVIGAFNAIPIVALAPVVINLTRDVSGDVEVRSTVAKIIVVALLCAVVMSLGAYRGLTDLKPFSEDLLLSYAADRKTIFLKLRLPNSVPHIFIALRVIVPTSVISALISEYFAEYIIGIGRMIRDNITLAQYATAWAYIVVACGLGIASYAVLLLVEKLVCGKRWRT
ncbi:MAG: ABC transporter permease subunit [Clostridiales Family XIII bacterium]|jgi:NitT/TauT family transport system permease protein|nr:ABC transporter permease subunit [Clostridiales Family XIII bacterium]